MLWEGFNLMLIGMGTVYLFLTLLVFCTQLMSRLVARYFPEAVPPPLPPPDRRQDEVLAAVSAAVHHHRHRR